MPRSSFITHDPNHALPAADRACFLRDGACVAEGAIGDVLTLDSLTTLYRGTGELVHRSLACEQAFLPG